MIERAERRLETFHSYRPCSPTGTPLCRVVTCTVVVDGNCVVSGTTASKRAQQRVVAVAGEEVPAEGVEQDEDDVPSARGHAVERDAALPYAEQARHRVRQRGEAAVVVAGDDHQIAAGWPNISPSRAAIARSPSMSIRPVSSALPGSRSPPASRTKSTTPSLSVSAGALGGAGPDARALGPEGDRPAHELAVRSAAGRTAGRR